MLKKTIKYTDYNGQEREEDFYFNLTKAECMEMEMTSAGGYEETVRRIISSHDGKEIMNLFKGFIFKAYGEKSPDGKHLFKSEELSRNFECTEAYSELFMELCTDGNAAAAFVSAVLPFNDDQRKEFDDKVVKTTELPSET